MRTERDNDVPINTRHSGITQYVSENIFPPKYKIGTGLKRL